MMEEELPGPLVAAPDTSIANHLLPFQCKPKSLFKSKSYRDFYSTKYADP